MFKDKRGTTLVEIIVSVAIIGVLSSIFLVNIRLNDKDRLIVAAEQLAADLRQIRNMAFSRTIYDMNGTLEYPPGGYGLVVEEGNSNTYKIFAENSYNNGYQADEDELIKEIILDDTFIIQKNNTFFYLIFSTEHNIQYSGTSLDIPIIISYSADSINITLDYLETEDNYWGKIIVGEI